MSERDEVERDFFALKPNEEDDKFCLGSVKWFKILCGDSPVIANWY
jgi:hypothetical protein